MQTIAKTLEIAVCDGSIAGMTNSEPMVFHGQFSSRRIS